MCSVKGPGLKSDYVPAEGRKVREQADWPEWSLEIKKKKP